MSVVRKKTNEHRMREVKEDGRAGIVGGGGRPYYFWSLKLFMSTYEPI